MLVRGYSVLRSFCDSGRYQRGISKKIGHTKNKEFWREIEKVTGREEKEERPIELTDQNGEKITDLSKVLNIFNEHYIDIQQKVKKESAIGT